APMPRHARSLPGPSRGAVAAAVGPGCSDKPKVETRVAGNDHFVSKAAGSNAPNPIDLPAVEKAFWETQGQDMNTWMGAFETRVNQLYDGGTVSLDARRNPQNLMAVTGYLEQNSQPGYQATGDAKLFAIDQTSPAQNHTMGYNVSGYDNSYYPRHHSLLDNPFVEMMIIGSLLQRPYYTPATRVIILHNQQTAYRQTPTYQAERTARQRAFGTTTSKNAFGTAPKSTGTTTTNRSWAGKPPAGTTGTTTTPGTGTTSAWGGQRGTGTTPPATTGTGRSPTGTSSWGGSRATSTHTAPTDHAPARSSGSSSSWGGRRSSSSSARRR
ncbi:MAG: hypothetical protein H7338_12480, partial [Candidatus Sericytochromatia bacterium]|nr:hypothetical protein [Candidatus Sericytochromatia bacterium]